MICQIKKKKKKATASTPLDPRKCKRIYMYISKNKVAFWSIIYYIWCIQIAASVCPSLFVSLWVLLLLELPALLPLSPCVLQQLPALHLHVLDILCYYSIFSTPSCLCVHLHLGPKSLIWNTKTKGLKGRQEGVGRRKTSLKEWFEERKNRGVLILPIFKSKNAMQNKVQGKKSATLHACIIFHLDMADSHHSTPTHDWCLWTRRGWRVTHPVSKCRDEPN